MKTPFRFFATGADRPVLQDRALVHRLYRSCRLQVMLAVTFGYGIAYTCRLALSVVKKPLIVSGLFSADDLGLIGSALFYGYALGKFTNGFLADHANLKRFFSAGVLVSALINVAMGQSVSITDWIVLWGLNGWFQGFGAPTGGVTLSNWFSNRERGRYYGIWSTAHAMGEGLTFFAVAGLVSVWGWRAGFLGPGSLCVGVSAAIYLLMKDRPRTLGLPPVAEYSGDRVQAGETATSGIFSTQLSIFRLPAVWIVGLASAAMYVSRYAINSWGILYLQETKGFSLMEAGSLIGLNTMTGIVGCVAYGFISDNLFGARRPPVTLIFGLLEVAALGIIFYGPPRSLLLLASAFAVYGFTLSGLLAALGGLFAIDLAPKRAAGAVMGFIGVFSYIGAGIQDQISGHLIELGTTVVDGVRHYDFSQARLFWLGSSVLSLVLAATLWRARVRD